VIVIFCLLKIMQMRRPLQQLGYGLEQPGYGLERMI
jgi:hypothetical protein